MRLKVAGAGARPVNERTDTIERMQPSRETENKTWRPSEAQKERLASLTGAPTQQRKSVFRNVRLAIGILLLFILAYVFFRLWRDPSSQGLHGPLAIFGGAILLLLIAAAVAKRLRPRKRDDKSVLRL